MNKLAFLSILSSLSCFAYSAEGKTSVTLSSDTIYYHGPLSEEANNKVNSLITKESSKIKWFSITSTGGEVNKGMALGDIIFKHNLNVEVNEYCLSSCANYVFTSAQHHRISNYATIGFHGGATGMKKGIEAFLESLPENEQKAKKEALKSYAKKTITREKNFFNKIGVNQKITTLGQDAKYQEQHNLNNYVGWYYSLEDLKKLGVKNVEVINPHWNYKNLSEKTKFFKVSVTSI